MKTKINVKKLFENYYFDFENYSDMIFTVDDETVSVEELKQGVEVNKEFYIETKPKFKFHYKKDDDFFFVFKIGITKFTHNKKQYWTYNGYIEIEDKILEEYKMNVDHFWELYTDFAEEYQEEEVLESRYYDTYSIYGLVEKDIFRFSTTGVYNSFKEAVKEFDGQVMFLTELLSDKYNLARAFIEHLENM